MFVAAVFNQKIPTWDVSSHQINQTLNAHFDKDLVFVKIDQEFSTALKETYKIDNQWQKIKTKFWIRINLINVFDNIEFILEEDQIYYVSREATSRFCISWSLKKRIYTLVHDNNHYCKFHRVYVRISNLLYIRHLTKRLRKYIKHCRKCQKDQTVRHVLYKDLKLIRNLILLFYTITLNFIISLLTTSNNLNAVFITIDKFSKKSVYCLTKLFNQF